ncbi:MAG: double-strand break repair helicase AddA [Nitratireductor sp.]
MSGSRTIPADTLANQALASDPGLSAWVSANAGSGKTHVLSRRVMRLLLEGVDPARILCLTYTKAAAANMATRVFADLGRWATLDDGTLTAEIGALEQKAPDGERVRLARRLFARALETPGGLKIQTIHAFCEALLHRFPLEANIAGHFELLDGRMEQALVAEARRDLLAGVTNGDDAGIAEAFATVLAAGGEHGLEALLNEIVGKRDALRRFIAAIGGDGGVFADLLEEFGFSGDEDEAGIVAASWPDAYFDAGLAARFGAGARAAKKKTAEAFAAGLAAACAAPPMEGFSAARALFLNEKKAGMAEPRPTERILAKGVAEYFPEFATEFARAADSIAAAADRLSTWRMVARSRAALTLADWLIARYERLKSARGFLDFNDLITRSVWLLSRTDVGAWVQYKLDQGIDHILVDEAQDTSPDQWQVVARLTEDFFAGAGARSETNRTIFAVGDEKQSIYSFQGAEPEAFERYKREFSRRVESAGGRFAPVTLAHSFRSTEDVLAAVDQVFAVEEARAGLTRDPEPIEHKAIRVGEPGHVELWDQIAPEQVEAPEDWTEPVDHASAPAARLAEIVADTVAHWLKIGEVIEGRGRPVTPGDVLVLVRKRDRFINALSRALKNREIAVAGADRLNLRAHIAVQDMMALARFVLQPQDDLSLATLLKSPVFGLDEEALYALAADRGPARSLYGALRARADAEPRWQAIAADLARWRGEADTGSVFAFFAAILARDGVRRKMVRRLGHEAGDILDEFLNFCLAAEQAGTNGLEAFLATLENAGPDIRREMDQARDEVRIMTVHASKGLEAPIVILVDNGAAPFSDSHLPRLMPFRSQKRLWADDGFVWRSGADVANRRARAIADGIAHRAREEYRRLLYVGMTRAEDRLIICGYRGVRAPQDGIWHTLAQAAFATGPVIAAQHPVAELGVRRFRVTHQRAAPDVTAEAIEEPKAPDLPGFLTEALPPPPALPRPLSPSGAGLLIEAGREEGVCDASPVLAPAGAASPAAQRGTAIHRLLQMLPDVPPTAREAAARRYLDRFGADWPAAERESAWRSVRDILENPDFAPVFAAGSRAEVALMGTLRLGAAERAVSGKVDRLAVGEQTVLIVDYKTNRPPPLSLATVPPAYLAQLALYRALLQPLYAGRRVEAALLFTEAPALVRVPAAALDEALVRLTAA